MSALKELVKAVEEDLNKEFEKRRKARNKRKAALRKEKVKKHAQVQKEAHRYRG